MNNINLLYRGSDINNVFCWLHHFSWNESIQNHFGRQNVNRFELAVRLYERWLINENTSWTTMDFATSGKYRCTSCEFIKFTVNDLLDRKLCPLCRARVQLLPQVNSISMKINQSSDCEQFSSNFSGPLIPREKSQLHTIWSHLMKMWRNRKISLNWMLRFYSRILK